MNASETGTPHSPGQHSRRMLARGLVLAVTLHAFEQIAIVAILEDVVSDLDGRDFSGVIFGVYLLASILASVIAGTRIDRHGPLGAFAVGLVCFAVGLAAAAMAGSVEVFIAARAVQERGRRTAADGRLRRDQYRLRRKRTPGGSRAAFGGLGRSRFARPRPSRPRWPACRYSNGAGSS